MRVSDRAWSGATVAILASGPSLTADEAARLRGRVRAIAVNDAIRLAPWAEVLYSSDRRWWKAYGGAPWFTGAKFSIGPARGRSDEISAWPEIHVLRHTGIEGLELASAGLRSGEHSGYAAINLAVQLGAARIWLLGYDLAAPASGPSHFFGRHPAGLPETSAPEYARFRRHYGSMLEDLAAAGVSVTNTTLGSQLEAFPRRPLGELLELEALRCR